MKSCYTLKTFRRHFEDLHKSFESHLWALKLQRALILKVVEMLLAGVSKGFARPVKSEAVHGLLILIMFQTQTRLLHL